MIDPLDKAVKIEFDKIFSSKNLWSVRHYSHIYTAGLHSNERSATVESFMRIQHKFDSSIADMLESCKRLQQKDMSLECNSKEAHSYFTHPVYTQMRKRFSQYALTLMLHQMLVSYKFTAFEDDEVEEVPEVPKPGEDQKMDKEGDEKKDEEPESKG